MMSQGLKTMCPFADSNLQTPAVKLILTGLQYTSVMNSIQTSPVTII